MIAYLEGRLLQTFETGIVLVTDSGVGYEVELSTRDLARLPEKGGAVSFYIQTVVREDALDLYGFADWDARQTFGVLISVNRLGPKTGLAILATFTPDELRALAAGEDPTALTRVSGIGKKTAQQIFLELKYKLKGGDPVLAPAASPGGLIKADAVAGLCNLGYAEEEARSVVEAVLKDEPDLGDAQTSDVSALLRAALKRIAASR